MLFDNYRDFRYMLRMACFSYENSCDFKKNVAYRSKTVANSEIFSFSLKKCQNFSHS